MANENKNTHEVVADDDITAELKELTLQQVLTRSADDEPLEDDANTFEFERSPSRPLSNDVEVLRSNLKSHSNTIGRMQFELEQLRSKWQGLQSEARARAAIGDELNRQVGELREALENRNRLLGKRDRTIRSLKAEIRDREAAHHTLEQQNEQLSSDHELLRAEFADQALTLESLREAPAVHDADVAAPDRTIEESASGGDERHSEAAAVEDGPLAEARTAASELAAQLAQREIYADELRRRLDDLTTRKEHLEQREMHLSLTIEEHETSQDALSTNLREIQEDNRALGEQICSMQHRHTEDTRKLRERIEGLELAAAALRTRESDLTARLKESKDYRGKLEQMLGQNDGRFRDRITELEQHNAQLEADAETLEQKLANKTAAVNCLLAELASQNEAAEAAAAEISDSTLVGIEERLAEGAEQQRGARDGERVNRMLIGRIDNQELRFPLFKNRLTIGRTQQNDIQLNVPYISRRHAVVLTEGNTTRVVDWGSKNGVYVNSRRITEHFLKSGDRVTIGNADFHYEERIKRDG